MAGLLGIAKIRDMCMADKGIARADGNVDWIEPKPTSTDILLWGSTAAGWPVKPPRWRWASGDGRLSRSIPSFFHNEAVTGRRGAPKLQRLWRETVPGKGYFGSTPDILSMRPPALISRPQVASWGHRSPLQGA